MLVGNTPHIEQSEKLYNEIKSKICNMVAENLPFDSVYFNTLTLENLRLTHQGKSLIWWLSWAVSKGRAEAFEFAWLKYNQSYTYQDFQQVGTNEPSSQCLLAHAALIQPRPINWVLQRWSGQLTADDLRATVQEGPFKNLSMINVLIRAAKDKKINRQVINAILTNIPHICSKQDMLRKSENEPSIHEMIEEGVAHNCDWCVKLKRLIEARNAFFEGLWYLLNSNSTVNDFALIDKLASSAQGEGYVKAEYDADVIVTIIRAAQKHEWLIVIELLKNNALNESIITDDLYNALSRLAKTNNNMMVINQINRVFARNRQYNIDDYTQQYNSLQGYKDRFKQPTGTFVSHALVKKGIDGAPLCAMQFFLPGASVDGVPNIVKLKNINVRMVQNGSPYFDAVTVDNQKMVSTDSFSVELQTKVDAVFVCEKYDLIFFTPQTNQGVFVPEKVDMYKSEAKSICETDVEISDEMNAKSPVVRGGERDINLTDLYMRQAYPDQAKLKERERSKAEETLQAKTSELYSRFYHFYNSFFTEKMLSISQKINEGKWLFAPEALHAIAKMFFRPSEQQHYDIKNLAIAPKWLNSLMMVIESTLRWHVVHAPLAKLHLKTLFKTFPMHHVLREGTIEATLSTDTIEVKVSKELVPYQKNPPFPQMTDITQATFVLNSLLNRRESNQIPLTGVISTEPPKMLTIAYDSPSVVADEPKDVLPAAMVVSKPN